jgi:histidine triad (HIT) family protein
MAIELPSSDPCATCDLVAGATTESRTELRRTANTVAWLTTSPAAAAEVVIASRRHAPTIVDLTDEEADAVFIEARDLSRALAKAFDPDGITLHQHNGTIEGQAAPHFELCLGPRRFGNEPGERPQGWGQEPFRLTDEIAADWMQNYRERLVTASRIREAISDGA